MTKDIDDLIRENIDKVKATFFDDLCEMEEKGVSPDLFHRALIFYGEHVKRFEKLVGESNGK